MRDVARDAALGGHQTQEKNASKLQWNLIETVKCHWAIRERQHGLHYAPAPTLVVATIEHLWGLG